MNEIVSFRAREHAWCGRRAFCRKGACREEEPAVMGTGGENISLILYNVFI